MDLIEWERCRKIYVKPCLGTIVLQGGWPLFLHRMGVMLMKHFDFKDLMAFGIFILG